MKVRDLKATLVAVPIERGEAASGSADRGTSFAPSS